MPLPVTIRTSVSQNAITKVGRLFNGTITDVLGELLQNARRAAATKVEIEALDLAGHPTLCVRDDGRGIDDPNMLVTLGQSGWDEDVARREDPAGMGVFSLAGHRVEIRSFSATVGHGWRVVIPPDAWQTSRPLAVEPFDHGHGTEILVDLPEAWEKALDQAIANVTRHYPLPVFYQGAERPRSDWLADAVHIEDWQGVRIGVFESTHYGGALVPRINFHGLTVPCRFPSLWEIRGGRRWHVRIDIVDAPDLQLVLPARKEMVENEALERLRHAAIVAIYHRVAASGPHRLAYKDWCAARDAGVLLAEAEPALFARSPPIADSSSYSGTYERLTGDGLIVMADFEPPIAQSAARALRDGSPLDGRLVDAEPAFEGYRWYDALRRVEGLRFRIEQQGSVHLYDDMSDRPALDSGHVDGITLEVDLRHGDAITTVPFQTDVVIAYDASSCWGVEDAGIFVAADAAITPDALSELLDACCFASEDDSGADSWETQHDRFLLDAMEVAIRLLLGDDEAVLARISTVLRDRLCWLVPEGRSVSIQLARGKVELALGEAIPADPAQPAIL